MSGPAWGVLVLSLLAPRAAFASDSHAYRLAFAAPEGCPGAADMMRLVEERSARAHAANPIEPAIDFGAQIVEEAGGFLGLLRVRTLDGAETTRAVPATTCAEAVSAMALIVAIVVDPDAALSASSTAGTEPAVPHPEPQPSAAPEPAPAPKSLPPEAPAADRGPPARASASGGPLWWIASAEAGITSGI